jgi:hypothetical protein
MAVARELLPDILSYDARRPASYPHNGRTLTDDVVDVFFSMLTNGKVTGDKVGAARRSTRRVPVPWAAARLATARQNMIGEPQWFELTSRARPFSDRSSGVRNRLEDPLAPHP